MKFKFKRKYNTPFFILLFLIAISFIFYFVAPKFINENHWFFINVLVVSIFDSFIITIFILGLYREKYYLYHDHLEIHRSLRRTIELDYNNIEDLVEFPNDKTFLIFGTRPSFLLKYKNNNKIKKYRIRVEKYELLKLVMENEKKIHISKNK